MSVSKQQLQDFSKLIKNHPAFDEVIERIQKGLFMASVGATKEQRGILSDQMDALTLFVGELNTVIDSISEDDPINDDTNDPDEDS